MRAVLRLKRGVERAWVHPWIFKGDVADLVAALRSAVGDVPVFVSDDPVPAGLEGFEPLRGWLDTPGPASVVVEEPAAAGTVRLGVTFGAGHKTGLYLDQGENRRRFGAL